MPSFDEHPTVVRIRNQKPDMHAAVVDEDIDADWLHDFCLKAGADDVGFVSINRQELDDQRDDIFAILPETKSLVSFVCRMNREPIRNPARSLSNLEFHHVGDKTNDVAREIVSQLEKKGIRAVNPSMGFPMEMMRFPGKIWTVSHKPIAIAAGLGQMGIHRNVIHPKFGNFILLGTVLVERAITETSQPIDYNPCLECKLCVAACPVGAIGSDDVFNFSACLTHNYREFLGGFTDWVGNIADSKNSKEYRERIEDIETLSMWQSLSFGPNYKSAYCMAVCPAGEDVIAPYLEDKKSFISKIVRPLQEKVEPVYVIPQSDAEEHVTKRYPHKRIRQVSNGIRVRTIQQFLIGLQHIFQPNKSEGLSATYHFTFTGEEQADATITIKNKSLFVKTGHEGTADLHVTADSRAWLKFLAKDMHIAKAIILRKVKLKGPPKLLLAFGKCFPS